jgi:hypothetical protein
VDGAAARVRQEFVHGDSLEQRERSRRSLEVRGVDHEHRLGGFDMGE